MCLDPRDLVLELLAQRVLVRGLGDPGTPQQIGNEEKDEDAEPDQHPANPAYDPARRESSRRTWGRDAPTAPTHRRKEIARPLRVL